jgi:hypothetical protein
MSWIEKVKNNLIIRTGDGREFNVLWRNASRTQEYNVASFDFPQISGTLVKRREPKGMQYEVEFYFQGENNLDDAEDFRRSADDKRYWVLIHPFYGRLNVQPTSLKYDNTALNITRVTGTVIETIIDDHPKTSADPKDKITRDKAVFDETAAVAFANNVEPSVTDINQMTENNALVYAVGKKKVKLTVDSERYFNAFNTANAQIVEATAEPLAAIRQMQVMLNMPALFEDSVQNRLKVLLDQFNLLRDTLEGITERHKKLLFESNQGSIVSSMLVAVANPQEGDYGNRNEVYSTIDSVLGAYNTYVEDLDDMQTDNGGDPESYIPDAASMTQLNQLLNFTLSNLFNIALDSKQERTVILEDDSNAILLAHRFYGLLPDDSTIDAFISQNEIGINETLHIKKGRPVKYYV